MNNRKTYYIGAGASFHSLPLVNSIPQRIRVFRNFLLHRYNSGNLKNNFAPTYFSELNKLIEEIDQSTSIDSYAKELHNGNKQIEHLRLKAILSGYIVFEQLSKSPDFEEYAKTHLDPNLYKNIKTTIDKRYRTFWGEMLDNINRIPNTNTSILSWNYDMQFEYAYSRMYGVSIKIAQQDLNVFPSELSQPKDGFSIIKLNGTAGLFKESGSSRNRNLFYLESDSTTDEVLGYIIDHLKNNYHRSFSDPILNFAWEHEGDVNLARQQAKNIIAQTHTLIIIGYSFPTYNREIDIELLGNATHLQKIVFQSPKDDVESKMEELFEINDKFRDITVKFTNLNSFAK